MMLVASVLPSSITSASTARPHASAGISRSTLPSAPSSSRAAITATTGANRTSGYSMSNALMARSRTSSLGDVRVPAMGRPCRSVAAAPRPAKRGRLSLRGGTVRYLRERRGRRRTRRSSHAALGADAARVARGRRRLPPDRGALAAPLARAHVRPDSVAELGARDPARRPVHDVRAVVEAPAYRRHAAGGAARRRRPAGRLARRRARAPPGGARALL